MHSSINTAIPSRYYKLLGIWKDLCKSPEKLPYYIEVFHEQISKSRVRLSEYEKIVLEGLISSSNISYDNLYWYLVHYEDLNPSDSLLSLLFGWINSINWNLINNPSEELLVNHNQIKRERIRQYLVRENLERFLKRMNFIDADILFLESGLSQCDYEKLKSKYIKKYFSENYLYKNKPFILDDEQAKAIGAIGHSILVQARAGSGKTHVITAKVISLLESYNIDPKQIMVLAFNRKVPIEIVERIEKNVIYKYDPDKFAEVKIASTFHKFALNLIGKKINILVDKSRSTFIKEIISSLRETDEEFRKSAFNFYKDQYIHVEKKQFSRLEDYYDYVRNLRYKTLKGEVVRSYGEKILADYFYEHDIKYYYEYAFYPKKCLTKNYDINQNLNRFKVTYPDFYLPEYNLVWEHWAIDEDSNVSTNKEEFNKLFSESWDKYYSRMMWKRWFWGGWRKYLIESEDEKCLKVKSINALEETRASDILEGRENFEKLIEQKLQSRHIEIKASNSEELAEKLWNNTNDEVTNLLIRFIDRYQHQSYKSKKEFKKLMEEYKNSFRVYSFLQMGLKVLNEYENRLRELGNTLDFNQVVATAANIIRNGKEDDKISNLKWVLIDEYQDFSPLFYNLIEAIREVNPEVKLFCVGDNWQAINGFAGADTKYFNNFISYFPNANIETISTNYRSFPEIVNRSSKFMQKSGFQGNSSRPSRESNIKQVKVEYIEDTHIMSVFKSGQDLDIKFKRQFPEYRSPKRYVNYQAVRYLKRMYQIVKENRGKSVLFLHRMNKYMRTTSNAFEEMLINLLTEDKIYPYERAKELISFKTMHGSKGLEADVVVILEVDEGVLPMYHPDNVLFAIFGDSLDKITAEQQKLFYVAATRGRERTYIISSKWKQSSFARMF